MEKQNLKEQIGTLWLQIKAWYTNNIPNVFEPFEQAPGATTQEIKDFEAAVGLELPEAYKYSLGVHNGGGFIANFTLNTLSKSLYQWQNITELAEAGTFSDEEIEEEQTQGIVQNIWWDSKWIPFASDPGGDMLCIDLNPAEKGVVGQIIYMGIHSGPSPTEYKSFLEWLQGYYKDLQDGRYKLNEQGQIVYY